MSVKRINKLYMLSLVLLPVFAQYHIGGTLDYDVIIMAAFFIITIATRPRVGTSCNSMVLMLTCYVVIVVTANIFCGRLFANESDIILRSGRFVLYMVVVLVMKLNDFDYNETMKIYRVVAFCALFYILLQTIVYYVVGIILPSTIGGSTHSVTNSQVGRLHSFYSEPADMALSLIPFVCCSLFGPAYRDKDSRIFDAILITLAVFMSTAGQGTVFLIILWTIWIICGRKSEYTMDKILIATIIGVAILYIIKMLGLMDYTLKRVTGNSSAWEARSGGYTALQMLGGLQRFFGTGFGNYFSNNIYGLNTYGEFVNFSSFSESLFTLGIVGTLIVYIPLIKRFFSGCAYQKALIFAFLFLSVASCPLSGKFFPIYYSFIFCEQKKATI